MFAAQDGTHIALGVLITDMKIETASGGHTYTVEPSSTLLIVSPSPEVRSSLPLALTEALSVLLSMGLTETDGGSSGSMTNKSFLPDLPF